MARVRRPAPGRRRRHRRHVPHMLGDNERAQALALDALAGADASPFAPATLRRALAQPSAPPATRPGPPTGSRRRPTGRGRSASPRWRWRPTAARAQILADLGSADEGLALASTARGEAAAAGSDVAAAWARAVEGSILLRIDPARAVAEATVALAAGQRLRYAAGDLDQPAHPGPGRADAGRPGGRRGPGAGAARRPPRPGVDLRAADGVRHRLGGAGRRRAQGGRRRPGRHRPGAAGGEHHGQRRPRAVPPRPGGRHGPAGARRHRPHAGRAAGAGRRGPGAAPARRRPARAGRSACCGATGRCGASASGATTRAAEA